MGGTSASGHQNGSWKVPRIAEIGMVVLGLGGTGFAGYGVIEHRLTQLEIALEEMHITSRQAWKVLDRLEVQMGLSVEHRGQEGHPSSIRAIDNHGHRIKSLEDRDKNITHRLRRVEGISSPEQP